MKLLLTLLIATTGALALRDLSQYQDRSVLYPHKLPAGPFKRRVIPGLNSKIVGGVESTPNSHPFIVALFIDDQYFCGGSILNEEWILTAAHCVDGAGYVRVVAGAHNVREDEDTQVEIRSTDLIANDDYNSFLITRDTALIRLPTKLEFTDAIQPITRAEKDPADGSKVMSIGWGKPSDSASGISDVLREVVTTHIPFEDCEEFWGLVDDGQFCIDTTGGKGTCSGDSGGPTVFNGELVGITSYGSSSGCEVGAPAGLESVAFYHDWICENALPAHVNYLILITKYNIMIARRDFFL